MLDTILKKQLLDFAVCRLLKLKHVLEFLIPLTPRAAIRRYAGEIDTMLRTAGRLRATGVLESWLVRFEKRENRRSQRGVGFIRDAVDRCVPKRGGADIDQVELKVFSLVMREWKRGFSVKWVCGTTADSSALDATRFPDTEAELKSRLHSQIVKSTVDGSVLPTLSKGFLYETTKFVQRASDCVPAS